MLGELTIPQRFLEQQGLAPTAVTLRDLGPIVILAGANGSGKTRFLRSIERTIEFVGEWCAQLPTVERSVEEWRRLVADPTTPEQDVIGYTAQLAMREAYHGVRVDGPSGPALLSSPLQVIHLTYNLKGEIADADNQPPNRFERAVRTMTTAGFSNAYPDVHTYLTIVARHLFNTEHPALQNDDQVKRQKRDADDFNRIVTALLGMPIGWQIQEETGHPFPLVMGRRFSAQELSDGQKILLTWAIILHRQREHLANAIVILDEPENYLHPDICIRALDKLQKDVLGNGGQIWLATHSLPLIAWAGAESLYFVQDGAAVFAGSMPSTIWQSLIGGAEARDALVSFLDGDAAAAATRFASDCLLHPEVAPARPGDPQPKQLVSIVADRLRTGQGVRMLEIGAGAGRLVHAVAEMLRTDPSLRPEQLTYIAYEDARFLIAEHKISCERHLETLRSLGVQAQHSIDFADLKARNVNHVDLTVLANTLHEVPVDDWLHLFEQIRHASKPAATLLVIEDQEPRIGELPHPRGFLILEKAEWEALVDAEIRERVDVHAGRRLTAFEIPVDSLGNVSTSAETDVLPGRLGHG